LAPWIKKEDDASRGEGDASPDWDSLLPLDPLPNSERNYVYVPPSCDFDSRRKPSLKL